MSGDAKRGAADKYGNLDEEGRTLLRDIIEAQAWRQLSSMNILGHCLKYVTRVDSKLLVAEELQDSLQLFREVRALYQELGWTDIEAATRDRIDRIPMPGSRLEFGLCRYLVTQAELVAMKSYSDCSVKPFAAIARSYVETTSKLVPKGDPVFIEYCKDGGNRHHAQSMFNRWYLVAMRSFGRPGSHGDRRAVELGLRNASAADMIASFQGAIDGFRKDSGLTLPPPEESKGGMKGQIGSAGR